MKGQELMSLTLEDLIPGGESTHLFQPEDIDGLQWWGEQCIYTENSDSLFLLNPKNGEKSLLFTFDSLNDLLEKKGLNKVYRPNRLSFPDGKKYEVYVNSPGKGYALVDLAEWKVRQFIPIPSAGENVDFNNLSRTVAYTKGNNLFVSTADKPDKAITDEPDGIVCGQSVHRDEFGITKGTFWSPDGKKLAFYRMDESMVSAYPLVNTDVRCAEVDFIRYPMAGMTSHQVTVGIYNTADEKVLFLQTGDPTDRYFTNITWSPDGSKIYLIELNRDQNKADLVRYDASTGNREGVIYEETHPKYVHPTQPIHFLPWDEELFLLRSQRDGYNHLYLYHTKGKFIRQLTQGEWIVRDVIGFDSEKKEVLITSNELSPLQNNLFRISLSNGKRSFMGTKKEGWQSAIPSPSGRYCIQTYSAHQTPREIDIIDGYGGNNIHLLSARNPYEGYRMPSFEAGTIKAADGKTDLYYRLLKPADFDPQKKYPVVIYVYGGPQIRLINDTWLYGTRGWDIYMANRGYLVFTLDNRGSSDRGFEFESCTFRHLGIEECKDQMKGVEYLKSLPYTDNTRIGVCGWSYGGYMTASLMLRYPDVFKAGVAGGAVTDWQYYEVMYGERYMDSPQENPDGYAECDLKNLAGQLKGRLLMIHDSNDPVVVPQHYLTFLKACVEARTYPDAFVYPGHGHNVLGRDRMHLYEKITRYFEEHLKYTHY